MSTSNAAMEDPHTHILAAQAGASNQEHNFDLTAGDWSRAEFSDILDIVFSNPAFLQSLSVREILKCKGVSKSWAAWYYANMQTISLICSQHESSDWYFPLFGKVVEGHTKRAWSGIWHADAHHSSDEQLHPLPSLGYLQSIRGQWSQLDPDIVTTGGGLLLTTSGSGRGSVSDNLMNAPTTPTLSLVVSNPLTKQVRVLPTLQWYLIPVWDVYPMDIHMLVDDEANTYKVIVYCYSWASSGPTILVYDSTSMAWELVLGKSLWSKPVAIERTFDDYYMGILFYGTACMRGRLYFGDIRAGTDMEVQNDPLVHGVLRLFEADIGDGQWKGIAEFPLRRSRDTRVKMIVGVGSPSTMSAPYNLELVLCMGRIFVVIPTWLDEMVHPWGSVRPGYADALGSTYLPVQFYVLQLDVAVADDGHLAHGVVRIEIPGDIPNALARARSLLQTMWRSKRPMTGMERFIARMNKNWFTCTAKGNEIWISCADYLLQYNIMSGHFKTHILAEKYSSDVKQWNFVYMPSFHLTP